jgi:hypothetical protein
MGAFDEQNGTTVPVWYQHAGNGDPGANIGAGILRPQRDVLFLRGQLKLGEPMADAVFERMLLPASDPMALKEFSVGYTIDSAKTFVRPDGVRIIGRAQVMEASVVFQGAQRTQLLSVKGAKTRCGTCGRDLRLERQTEQPRIEEMSEGETLDEFRKRMVTEHGDDDLTREAVGLPTHAELAEQEQGRRLADRAKALTTADIPAPLIADWRMRPHIEPVAHPTGDLERFSMPMWLAED